MPDLVVNIEGLGALDANLGASRDGLTTALTAMAADPADGLGLPELDRACAQFHTSWAFGLGKLGDCVDAVRGHIAETRTAYATTEDAISGAFVAMRAAMGPQP